MQRYLPQASGRERRIVFLLQQSLPAQTENLKNAKENTNKARAANWNRRVVVAASSAEYVFPSTTYPALLLAALKLFHAHPHPAGAGRACHCFLLFIVAPTTQASRSS